jgi:hypothetical protein
MRRVRASGWVLAAGLAATAGLPGGAAGAATGPGEEPQVAEARGIGEAADVTLRFIQEDGPESGHVRVVLTPGLRPLTVIEARMAAEQAFLQTLKEPGLGDALNRITVVVRMMPETHPDPAAAEQVVVYQHKGGRDWSVLPGE